MQDGDQTHERPTWGLRFWQATCLLAGLLTCVLLYSTLTRRSIASLNQKGCRTCGNPDSTWAEYVNREGRTMRRMLYCAAHAPPGSTTSEDHDPQWFVEIPFLFSPIAVLVLTLAAFNEKDPWLLAALDLGGLGSSGFLLLALFRPLYRNPLLILLLAAVAFVVVSYVPFKLWDRKRQPA